MRVRAREGAARALGEGVGRVGGGGEGSNKPVACRLGTDAIAPEGELTRGGAACVGEEGRVAVMAAAGGADGEGGGGGTRLARCEGGGGDEGTLGRVEVGEEGGEEAGGGGEDGVLIVGGEVERAIEDGGEVGVGEAVVVEGVGDTADEPEEGDVVGRRGGRELLTSEVKGEEVPVAETTISQGAGRVLVGGESAEDEGTGAVVGGGEDKRHVEPREALGSGPRGREAGEAAATPGGEGRGGEVVRGDRRAGGRSAEDSLPWRGRRASALPDVAVVWGGVGRRPGGGGSGRGGRTGTGGGAGGGGTRGKGVATAAAGWGLSGASLYPLPARRGHRLIGRRWGGAPGRTLTECVRLGYGVILSGSKGR